LTLKDDAGRKYLDAFLFSGNKKTGFVYGLMSIISGNPLTTNPPYSQGCDLHEHFYNSPDHGHKPAKKAVGTKEQGKHAHVGIIRGS